MQNSDDTDHDYHLPENNFRQPSPSPENDIPEQADEPQPDSILNSQERETTETAQTSLQKRKRDASSESREETNANADKDVELDSESDEDNGLTCPICLDDWEMSGDHRLCSLKCGHLFGESCIRRWLVESSRNGHKCCPQCKTRANSKDLRHLYAKRVRVIDRTEEYNLRKELDAEKFKCTNLQTELTTLKISHSLVLSQMKKLKSDIKRLTNTIRNDPVISPALDNFEKSIVSDFDGPILNYKLFMAKNIEITKEPGCRVMIYAGKSHKILVSQKSSQSLFPGYGVRFIETSSFRTSNFLHICAKSLRDISLSSDQNLLIAASMESKAKLFDLRTRAVVSLFSPSDKALWACAIDCNERENYLYLGSLGTIYVYDIRRPETTLFELNEDGDLSPVIKIVPVPANKTFPNGGFLVCKLQSIWFYEYTSPITSTKLNIEGPFMSMSYDPNNESLLVFSRSGISCAQSRYIVGKLQKLENLAVFEARVTFFGSKATPVMTRCSQIAVPSNILIAGYIQDKNQISLFDVRRSQTLQSMPAQEIVYDMCPIYEESATYLAALTETKCRIYKVISN